jgi:hypothetical protein
VSNSPRKPREKLYPIRLEGVYIAQAQQGFINQELDRRSEGDPKRRKRLRNPIVRDALDFAHIHYPLFLDWIATRGTIASE